MVKNDGGETEGGTPERDRVSDFDPSRGECVSFPVSLPISLLRARVYARFTGLYAIEKRSFSERQDAASLAINSQLCCFIRAG